MQDANPREEGDRTFFNYSIENLPFLLNCEYSNHAWSYTWDAYSIDPAGNKLDSVIPFNWSCTTENNQFGLWHEYDVLLNQQVNPDCLMEHLNYQTSKSGCIDKVEINALDMITSLSKSQLRNNGTFGCDMGMRIYSILIFDQSTACYKRVILKTTGNKSLINESEFTDELLNYFNLI